MTDYVAPDPKIANHVHEQKEELRLGRERLQPLSDDELKVIVDEKSDPKQRFYALSILVERIVRAGGSKRSKMEGPLTDLFADLLDDSHPDIAQMALRSCPLTTDDTIQKARQMLGSPEDQVRAAAAIALAKIKDETVFPTFLEWFHGDSKPNRNLAIESLKTLESDAAKQELRNSYETGGRDEEDRAVLAVALLRLGDTVGLEFLEDVAKRKRIATGPFSVMAATWIYGVHEPDVGLRLMLDILDRGDLDSKRSLVNQICFSWLHSPHAFTADAIHEARMWIERKLESSDKRPIAEYP